MRSPSHLSSSTVSTGTLVAARVKPALRRRVASSRPSRCGIETMRGADIAGFSLNLTIEIPHGSKTEEINGYLKWNLIGSQLFFPPRAEQQVPTAGLEETLDVDWNDYSYYSRYCIAWRLQRHRWRTVLRHGLLWRRRIGPCGRDPADSAAARKAVRLTPISGRHHPPPGLAFGEPDDRLQRVIRYAAPERFNFRCFGILDT